MLIPLWYSIYMDNNTNQNEQVEIIRDFLTQHADILDAPRNASGEPLIAVTWSNLGVRAAVCGGGRRPSEGLAYKRAQTLLVIAAELVDCSVDFRGC